MKISESWIRNWVNPKIDTTELVSLLTMAGLEVDGTEPAVPAFEGVVVAEIAAVEPHPDAEKLRVCSVNDGAQLHQVVCGAANAAVGLRVPYATLGAKLVAADGKDFKIKQAKLRGVESNGMLCGGSELGLEDIVDGLMVLPQDSPLGENVRSYLALEDTVIELDLTPNRGDCLSVLGVAREVAVLTGSELCFPTIEAVAASIEDQVNVVLEADDYCPSYVGRVVRHVDVSAETPIWMREKLRRAGLRCIDPVVDITNYVMLELGQPMHAFDLNKINGDVVVRRAKQGETIALLDGSEIEPGTEHLFIADQDQPLALAGIMGGASSAVGAETKDILLESAFFVPPIHAGKARELGMHTDSSHRFERGVDSAKQTRAIERATQLLLDITGGQPGPVNVAGSAEPSATRIDFRSSQIKRILGFDMPAEEVERIFTQLGLEPVATKGGWAVTVPSHRFDIAIEADLLEEIARVYGYDNLPVEPPLARMEFTLQTESIRSESELRKLLIARGYREAISYSFIDGEFHQSLFGDAPAVELTNPISRDMSTMRVSLVPGLLKSAQQNTKRQQTRLKLFEVGSVFIPSDAGLRQESRIGGLLYGLRSEESWLSKPEAVQARGKAPDNFDFYDVKSDVQALLSGMGLEAADSIEFRPLTDQIDKSLDDDSRMLDQLMHPGQAAAIYLNNQYLGFCGGIHPMQQKNLDEITSVWVFELDVNLISQKKVPEFKELSKFPEVRRDVAVIVDKTLSVGELLRVARDSAGSDMIDARVFDRYSGEGIDPSQQSIALGLTWQNAERTLTEEEVNADLERVVSRLSEQFNASLR